MPNISNHHSRCNSNKIKVGNILQKQNHNKYNKVNI